MSRAFLVAVAVLGVAAIASASPVHAEDRSEVTSETSAASEQSQSKKHAWLAEKQSRQANQRQSTKRSLERSLRRRVGSRPSTPINIFNTWTHETLLAIPESRRGGLRRARKRVLSARGRAEQEIVWHLRCHFTNEPTKMDARLFQVLIEAATHFEVSRIEIISGFRAPKYNLQLRKKGRQVARTSHHTRGEAVDFRLPGVPVSRLRKWARKLRLGGVGYYPTSAFIHVDIGKIRTWRGD